MKLLPLGNTTSLDGQEQSAALLPPVSPQLASEYIFGTEFLPLPDFDYEFPDSLGIYGPPSPPSNFLPVSLEAGSEIHPDGRDPMNLSYLDHYINNLFADESSDDKITSSFVNNTTTDSAGNTLIPELYPEQQPPAPQSSNGFNSKYASGVQLDASSFEPHVTSDSFLSITPGPSATAIHGGGVFSPRLPAPLQPASPQDSSTQALETRNNTGVIEPDSFGNNLNNCDMHPK